MVEGSDEIFDVSVVDFIDIIKFNVGDEVTLEYKEGERSNTVLSLNGQEADVQESGQEGDGEEGSSAGETGTTE